MRKREVILSPALTWGNESVLARLLSILIMWMLGVTGGRTTAFSRGIVE